MDKNLKNMLDLADHLGFVEEVEDFDDFDNKVMALAQYFNIAEDYCKVESIENPYDDYYEYENKAFLVLTDNEADQRLNEYLKDLLDEIVYTQIPDNLQCYFNEDAWIHDAYQDGRGHFLSGYDGCEEEENVDGTCYFIYRTN